MKHSLIFIAFFSISIGLSAADDKSKEMQMPEIFISGDADKGSQLVESCVACHGIDGNSISTDWPKLAGQNQKYLLEELKHFRDGERNNVLMMAVIPYLQTLSDKDYQELRTSSLNIIKGLKIEGGCNVQLAFRPFDSKNYDGPPLDTPTTQYHGIMEYMRFYENA